MWDRVWNSSRRTLSALTLRIYDCCPSICIRGEVGQYSVPSSSCLSRIDLICTDSASGNSYLWRSCRWYFRKLFILLQTLRICYSSCHSRLLASDDCADHVFGVSPIHCVAYHVLASRCVEFDRILNHTISTQLDLYDVLVLQELAPEVPNSRRSACHDHRIGPQRRAA